MPIYEYKCRQCDNIFELLQSFKAGDTVECPECQGKAFRQMAAFSAHFAGGIDSGDTKWQKIKQRNNEMQAEVEN